MLKTVAHIEVRYAETDQMGVVHHSHYPVYFEQARTEFFQQHLLPYAHFEAQGLLAPVLTYSVELKGRLGYGDTLNLEVFPSAIKGLRLAMKYRGFNRENLVVTGDSVHALTGPDLKPLHPRHLPEAYRLLRDTFERSLAEAP